MPRPLRIEYENAFYHVMNRGRARNNIFFKDDHYKAFLDTVQEACERFGLVVHAYCLMSNHYHLLLQTPLANLSRVMRHINGVYTQRFNRLQKIDGPLFRGRYKAILVESDRYLLHLTKYIHRNPIEVKGKRLVNDLKDYRWSSYSSYLDLSTTPRWLKKDVALSMLKCDQDILKRYELFVDEGNNPEIVEFFAKKNQDAILGKGDFKEEVCCKLVQGHEEKKLIEKEVRGALAIEQIIQSVVEVFGVTSESILQKTVSKKRTNFPRSLAMYLCQKVRGCSLSEIAQIFNLKNHRSVGQYLFSVRKELSEGGYGIELNKISQFLNMEL